MKKALLLNSKTRRGEFYHELPSFKKLSPREQGEAFRSLPADKRRKMLESRPPDERRELLESLPAEERLAGLPAEERLAGLSAEQIQQCLNRLTAGRSAGPRKRRNK
jgi:Mg/Co/Ni transporter MgtE